MTFVSVNRVFMHGIKRRKVSQQWMHAKKSVKFEHSTTTQQRLADLQYAKKTAQKS